MSSLPLQRLKVLEIGSIGPGPVCAMMLADHGAEVVRLERPAPSKLPGLSDEPEFKLHHRNRRGSLTVDLTTTQGRRQALDIVSRADVVLEGMRPGVAERLGIGPESCAEVNPAIVYGRMTGWGQDGPYATMAGHEINYLALNGTLSLMGRPGQAPPIPPGNLGDASAGVMLAFGVMVALWERETSGRGQVVDASVLDTSALLSIMVMGWRQAGTWKDQAGTNVGDGGAPFYDVYQTSDGRWLAVGAVEQKFYDSLLKDVLHLDSASLPDREDESTWPELRTIFANIFATRSLAEWAAIAGTTDACVTPVLRIDEVSGDPHVAARKVISRRAGLIQPAPAPRLSRTPATQDGRVEVSALETWETLVRWGLKADRKGVILSDT